MTKEVLEHYFQRYKELYECLKLWKLTYSKTAKRRLGLCSPRAKEIDISESHLQNATDEELLNTLKHEIAHALDWHWNGNASHGSSWKAIARTLGLKNPKSTKKLSYSPDYKYDVICPVCGKIGGRDRLLSGALEGTRRCKKCKSPVKFVKKH